MHPQLSSAQHSYILLSSAASCLALRCGAVSCCAVLSFAYSSTRCDAKYQVSRTVMYVRVGYSSFCFLQLIAISRSPCSSPAANYTRTADQKMPLPTSTQHCAQHRATSSAQAAALGSVNSLVAPHHGPLRSVPFLYRVALFLARAKRAASAALGAEPLYTEQKKRARTHVGGFLFTVFCAVQLALHEDMRSPNASYSVEPNASLVAARSACCFCRRCADPNYRDTSQCIRYAWIVRKCACCFSLVWETSPGEVIYSFK